MGAGQVTAKQLEARIAALEAEVKVLREWLDATRSIQYVPIYRERTTPTYPGVTPFWYDNTPHAPYPPGTVLCSGRTQ